MGNEIRMVNPAGVAGGSRTTRRTMPPSAPAPGGARSAGGTDRVSLSRVYHALKSSEMAVRLHSLQLQVAHRSYLIPSTEISRSIIEEYLQAA